MTDPHAVPTLDLETFHSGSAAVQRAIAARADAACRQTGFLVVVNHGVQAEVIDAAWEAAEQFFELPLERKMHVAAGGGPRGYFPLDAEALARTRGEPAGPDPKEAFSSGPIAPPHGHAATAEFDFFYGENRWPPEPPGFRRAWLAYYAAMESLGARIMSLLATSLGLPRDWFEPSHTHHLSALRALSYPASETAAGGVLAGAHSDYGSVTILRPDPRVGGLQIRLPDGGWIEAPRVADGFIVNIGDLMAHWTGGRWVSTLHRVIVPHGTPPARRQSIAYFMNPNYDAAILPAGSEAPAAGPAVTAGRYLIDRFRRAVPMPDAPAP